MKPVEAMKAVEADKPSMAALAARIVARYAMEETIPMEWLQAEFGIRVPPTGTKETFMAIQLETLTYLDHLKDVLLTDHLRALRNVRGQGYCLVHPERQTEYALGRLRKEMAREMGKCKALLVNVDMSLMSGEAVKRNTDAQASIASLALMTRNRMLRLTKEEAR